MREHVSRKLVLNGPKSKEILSLLLLFISLAIPGLVIGYPMDELKVGHDNLNPEFDHVQPNCINCLRTRKIRNPSILSNTEPSHVTKYMQYVPYSYMTVGKRSPFESKMNRSNLKKRFLHFNSMLWPTVHTELKNKQYLTEYEQESKPFQEPKAIKNRQRISEPQLDDEEAYYKKYLFAT